MSISSLVIRFAKNVYTHDPCSYVRYQSLDKLSLLESLPFIHYANNADVFERNMYVYGQGLECL